MAPVQWPTRSDAERAAAVLREGGFFGHDHKARLSRRNVPALRTEPRPAAVAAEHRRIRDQWHTMTRSGISPRLGHICRSSSSRFILTTPSGSLSPMVIFARISLTTDNASQGRG